MIKGITDGETGARKDPELSSPTDSDSNTGLIVGVVVVAAVAVAVFLTHRRKKAAVGGESELKPDSEP